MLEFVDVTQERTGLAIAGIARWAGTAVEAGAWSVDILAHHTVKTGSISAAGDICGQNTVTVSIGLNCLSNNLECLDRVTTTHVCDWALVLW